MSSDHLGEIRKSVRLELVKNSARIPRLLEEPSLTTTFYHLKMASEG
jgi:hypothetical protein